MSERSVFADHELRVVVHHGEVFRSFHKGRPFTVEGYAEIDLERGTVCSETGEALLLDQLIGCAELNTRIAQAEWEVVEAAVKWRNRNQLKFEYECHQTFEALNKAVDNLVALREEAEACQMK